MSLDIQRLELFRGDPSCLSVDSWSARKVRSLIARAISQQFSMKLSTQIHVRLYHDEFSHQSSRSRLHRQSVGSSTLRHRLLAVPNLVSNEAVCYFRNAFYSCSPPKNAHDFHVRPQRKQGLRAGRGKGVVPGHAQKSWWRCIYLLLI